MNNLRVLYDYLKSKEDSEEVLGRLKEIIVYCNDLELHRLDFDINNVPRVVRYKVARNVYNQVRQWIIKNLKF